MESLETLRRASAWIPYSNFFTKNMQKTLFIMTLTACSLALADTTVNTLSLDDAVKSLTGTVPQTTNVSPLSKSGAFSITATLNGDAIAFFKNYIGHNKANMAPVLVSLTGTYDNNNRTVGCAPGYSSGNDGAIKNGGLFLEAGAVAPNQASSYFGGGNFFGNMTAETWDNVTGMALTFTFNDARSSGINGHLYVTMNNKNGTTTTHSYDSAQNLYWSTGGLGSWSSLNVNTSYVNSVYLFDSVVTQANAFALNTAALARAVPEPATATLGLLALAGLAARRRRVLRAA